MPLNVLWFIRSLLSVFSFVLLLRVVLSFIPGRPGGLLADIADVVYSLTEPLLAPIRKLIPPIPMGMGYMDLSPLILIMLLNLVRGFLY